MMCNRVPLYCLPHVPRVLLKLLLFGVLFGRVARTCATCRAALGPTPASTRGLRLCLCKPAMLVSRVQNLPREGGAESSEGGGGKRGNDKQ